MYHRVLIKKNLKKKISDFDQKLSFATAVASA